MRGSGSSSTLTWDEARDALRILAEEVAFDHQDTAYDDLVDLVKEELDERPEIRAGLTKDALERQLIRQLLHGVHGTNRRRIKRKARSGQTGVGNARLPSPEAAALIDLALDPLNWGMSNGQRLSECRISFVEEVEIPKKVARLRGLTVNTLFLLEVVRRSTNPRQLVRNVITSAEATSVLAALQDQVDPDEALEEMVQGLT